MGKRRLLLVDADARSVRVMERNLSKAGHDVATAPDGEEALATIEWWVPDLVLCETRLPKVDGHELVRRLKARPEWSAICCAFLTRDRSVEERIRGLELGVDDYITKPIFVGDLISRVNLVLARRRPQDGATPSTPLPAFQGATDATILDLLKSLEVSGRSGVVHVRSGGKVARIYVHQGKAVDAEAGTLRGEDAIYRALIWNDAVFEVDLGAVNREDVITSSMQMVLVEAMRRVDDWIRLAEGLPALSTVLEIDDTRLLERLRDIPDEVHALLRLIDGTRSIAEVVQESLLDDVSSLALVARLHAERVLVPIAPVEASPEAPVDAPLDAPAAPPAPLAAPADAAVGASDARMASVPPPPPPDPVAQPQLRPPAMRPATSAQSPGPAHPSRDRVLLAKKPASATELLKWWPTGPR